MSMKTIVFKLSGKPDVGDLVILSYASQRGGRTHVMHRVGAVTKPIGPVTESLDAIARSLVDQIDKGWMKEAFEAKAKGSTVIVQCTGLVSDVTFQVDIEGSGVKGTIEEL